MISSMAFMAASVRCSEAASGRRRSCRNTLDPPPTRSRWGCLPEQSGEGEHPDQDHDAHARLPDQPAADPDVAGRRPAEDAVEAGVELARGPGGLLRPEQQAQSAGLNVRALNAEISTEMAMVAANCA